jgi:polyferredoxin
MTTVKIERAFIPLRSHIGGGGGGWVYGFLLRSENLFRTKQELEYLLFLARKARNFVPEFNIRLYDKNSESDYFFFLHQNQNIFFSNIGNQNIFFVYCLFILSLVSLLTKIM